MALARVKVWIAEILTAADLNAEVNNILNNALSLISPLTGSLDWDGFAHTLDAAAATTVQSTAAIGWTFSPGAKTGTPGATGGIQNWAASTWTDNATAASGTAATWTGHSIQRPTLAATNTGVITTDAATWYVANSPLAGTNQTLTNAWAAWFDAGNVRVDDNIHWFSGTSFSGILDHANTVNRTYTFQDSSDTIVGRATTDTLTNKTLTAPVLSGTITGTYTVGGTPTVSGAIVSGAAPATPTANVLYTDSVVKGWLDTSGGGVWTIGDDLNISSITDNGVGNFTINWARAFATGSYAIVGTIIKPETDAVLIISVISQDATTANLSVENTAGTLTDPATGVRVIAIGDQ